MKEPCCDYVTTDKLLDEIFLKVSAFPYLITDHQTLPNQAGNIVVCTPIALGHQRFRLSLTRIVAD